MPIKAINMLSVVLDSEKQTVLHNEGYKVVPLLNHGMWGSGGRTPCILTFGTIGECEGPILHPRNFTSGKHWRGARMDPRASLDTLGKTYVLHPTGNETVIV